jgi:hypothetical protein
MRKRNLILLLCMVLLVVAGCESVPTPQSKKFVIILQAGTESHEGLARALHALLYSMELKEGGHAVVLIFDGAGTEWARAMRDPNNKLHAKYAELEKLGIVEEICDFCAGAFKVKDDLKKQGKVPFAGEFGGHPSIRKWVDQGYEIVVL